MLNMDFSQRVVIDTAAQDWVASPMPGVWRKPLAREEAERGHATSIVRYEAGARFSVHDHPQGEEILVMEGVFSDETGDYPAGTYFRNPEGFRHAPFSEPGCILLVKLHQFQPGDSDHVCIDTRTAQFQPAADGMQILKLHEHKEERVALVRIADGGSIEPHDHPGGEEVYVLSGGLQDEHGSYPAGTWVRSPCGSKHGPSVNGDTLLWLKAGHLPHPR